jgi:hypothetical protein
MSWVEEYLDYYEANRRERLFARLCRYVYPTPLWAGGMDDLPTDTPERYDDGKPRTARGYAQKLMEVLRI